MIDMSFHDFHLKLACDMENGKLTVAELDRLEREELREGARGDVLSLLMRYRRELRAAERPRVFRGRTYLYPTPNDGTREIGVCHGLGTTWIVAWVADNGSRKRVKTNRLSCPNDPGLLQQMLDAWADERRLATA